MAWKSLSVHFPHSIPITYHLFATVYQHVYLYLVGVGEGEKIQQSQKMQQKNLSV